MNKDELQRLGAYSQPDAKKETVEWVSPGGEPVTFDVYILPRVAGAMFKARDVAKEVGDADNWSLYICTFVRLGDDGKQAFSYEEAYNLEPGLAAALVNAIVKVHGPAEKKDLPPTTNSSVSSSSTESGAAP